MAPRRRPILLYCDRATQTQVEPPVHNPWDDIFYMGSSRESTPPPARRQAAQARDPSYSPPSKESRSSALRRQAAQACGPSYSPPSKENSRRPCSGLGQINVVNTVASPSQDAANLDERPSKKRRVSFREDESDDEGSQRVQYDLSSVKESLDTMAAEARQDRQDILSTLQDLLHEIQQNRI